MTHQEKSKWVKESLNTESAEVLMMFVDYMYENGFTDFGESFGYLDYFKASDDDSVGLIHIYNKNDWVIYLNHKYFDHEMFPLDEEIAEFMQSQVKLNIVCSSSCGHCKEPEEFVIFGKTYGNACKNCRLMFCKINAEQMKKALNCPCQV